MTGPQLLAKYFVCYMQPVTDSRTWHLIAPMFRDLAALADRELRGELTHRQVREILQARVRDAKQVLKDHKAGKETPVSIGVADVPADVLSTMIK